MEIRYDISELDTAAEKVWDHIKGHKVVAFNGVMGAGKTTFIHALCRRLGVGESLSSPSFSIINEYASASGPVYHIDLYRCAHEEEVLRAGVEDCLFSGSLCFVEWPERAESIFPADGVRISITELDPRTRKLVIH